MPASCFDKATAHYLYRGKLEASPIVLALIPSATSPNERDQLILARRKAGGVAVEIGSASGASSCFIAAGIRPRGGIPHCVDRWNVEYRQKGKDVVCYLYSDNGDLKQYEWDNVQEKVIFKTLEPTFGNCPTYGLFLSITVVISV